MNVRRGSIHAGFRLPGPFRVRREPSRLVAASITVRPWCDLDQVIGDGFEREDARPVERRPSLTHHQRGGDDLLIGERALVAVAARNPATLGVWRRTFASLRQGAVARR
jgi:hypothetical protein